MVKVNIIGLDKVKANLSKMSTQLKTEVKATVEAGAKTFVRNAKRDAPKDFGQLAGSISYFPVSDLKFEIVSAKEYSPYVEWGTITRVSVPAEYQSYAIQFKGRGLRKSGGMYPHPYFFKQVPLVKMQIETGVKAIFNSKNL